MTHRLRIHLALVCALAVAASLGVSSPALAAGASKKVTASETFIALEAMSVSVVSDFRLQGVIEVEAGLEFEDHDLLEKAQSTKPRLRAACADALRAYIAQRYIPGRVPDADAIAEVIQTTVDASLGAPGAKVVLGFVIVQGAVR